MLFHDSEAATARRSYEQAAAAGKVEAMFNLGVLLHDSEPASARRWFEQAAAAGKVETAAAARAILERLRAQLE